MALSQSTNAPAVTPAIDPIVTALMSLELFTVVTQILPLEAMNVSNPSDSSGVTAGAIAGVTAGALID